MLKMVGGSKSEVNVWKSEKLRKRINEREENTEKYATRKGKAQRGEIVEGG